MNKSKKPAKTALVRWAANCRDPDIARAAREGYEFAGELLAKVALLAAPGDAIVLHGRDGGEMQRFSWEDRRAPNLQAFEAYDRLYDAWRAFTRMHELPPGLVAKMRQVQRVTELKQGASDWYTAAVLELTLGEERAAIVLPSEVL